MRDHFDFDLTPSEENCVQVGHADYKRIAMHEYMAMHKLLERLFGPLPEGCSISSKGNPHDFGTYYSLRLYFEDTDPVAHSFAFRVEADWPGMWDDEARAYLKANNALAASIQQ